MLKAQICNFQRDVRPASRYPNNYETLGLFQILITILVYIRVPYIRVCILKIFHKLSDHCE